jgi:hypothetical protein
MDHLGEEQDSSCSAASCSVPPCLVSWSPRGQTCLGVSPCWRAGWAHYEMFGKALVDRPALTEIQLRGPEIHCLMR